jgi:hypothetical protein
MANIKPKLSISIVMCFQYVFSVIISAIIIKLSNSEGGLFEGFTKGDAEVGLLNFLAMNCSSYAMKGVSAPFVMLSKCAKIIPVIMVGTIRGVYKPTNQ